MRLVSKDAYDNVVNVVRWQKDAEAKLGCCRIDLAKAEALAEARLEIIAKLEDRIAWMQGMIDAKDVALLSMRREGYDPEQNVAPTAVVRDEKAPLDAKILMAIESYAEPGSRDAGIMADDARLQLAAGVPADEVIREINRGSGINPHRL